MDYLITQIHNYFDLQDKEDQKWLKKSFWPSETESNVFDIYHKWMGSPVSNPIPAESRMMFQTAKLLETAYCNIFRDMGILVSDQGRVDMMREDIRISGYIDAIIYEGSKQEIEKLKQVEKMSISQEDKKILKGIIGLDIKEVPVEIKSYYGSYKDKELREGKAQTSHLKQLAIYMDSLDTDRGYLFYLDRGAGTSYQFIVNRKGDKFTCNSQEFNLTPIYKKWKRLYNNNILKKVEPKSEYKYKFNIDTLDWKSQTKNAISQARNGHKVIGDWQARYSSYFKLLIDREKTTEGYTEDELKKIAEVTKGYTAWK